jgi:hypothetical protein
VTSRGHPYAEFQRALKNGNVWVADAVARELPQVSLEDALRPSGSSTQSERMRPSGHRACASLRRNGRAPISSTISTAVKLGDIAAGDGLTASRLSADQAAQSDQARLTTAARDPIRP